MPSETTGRIAKVRRAVFARHANPWSAWSRWATTPLVLMPVWTRRWQHAVLVTAWFALNPVIYRTPADHTAWATRAMRGEEQWVVDRPRGAGLAVSVAASVAAAGALIAARRRRLLPAALATAGQMVLTLGYWGLMVRYFDRHRSPGSAV